MKMEPAMVPTATKRAATTRAPPAAQAALTGGMLTITAATPPSATKPIAPKLNRPAYPHWIFTPRLMIAEIRHRFRMVNATVQLCIRPTRTSIANTAAKRAMFFGFITTFP